MAGLMQEKWLLVNTYVCIAYNDTLPVFVGGALSLVVQLFNIHDHLWRNS